VLGLGSSKLSLFITHTEPTFPALYFEEYFMVCIRDESQVWDIRFPSRDWKRYARFTPSAPTTRNLSSLEIDTQLPKIPPPLSCKVHCCVFDPLNSEAVESNVTTRRAGSLTAKKALDRDMPFPNDEVVLSAAG
jgi:hypothetical protein